MDVGYEGFSDTKQRTGQDFFFNNINFLLQCQLTFHKISRRNFLPAQWIK